MQFVYKNLPELRAKLLDPHKYGGIIFTNPCCVQAVCKALQHQSLPRNWWQLRNFSANGSTHKLALNSLQKLNTIGKFTRSAHNMSNLIMNTFGSDFEPELPMLMPCGTEAGNSLRSHLQDIGFSVDACEVYSVCAHPKFEATMHRTLQTENVEFLVFFSVYSVKFVAQFFTKHELVPTQWKLIAVGSRTWKAMEDLGWKVHRKVTRPLAELLIKALIEE